MITAHPLDATVEVRVIEARELDRPLEREVERLWSSEQKGSGKRLFNGPIVSAVSFNRTRLDVAIAEYRQFVAQRAKPSLFEVLQIQPVAVSGILVCQSGIVVGSRARHVSQEPGRWELVPSGAVDATGLGVGSTADIRGQILSELCEEVGVLDSFVHQVQPFCLIEDHGSHVFDVGIWLSAPQLTSPEIHLAHQERATDEYERLLVWDQTGQLASMGDDLDLIPVSRAVLREFQRRNQL